MSERVAQRKLVIVEGNEVGTCIKGQGQGHGRMYVEGCLSMYLHIVFRIFYF